MAKKATTPSTETLEPRVYEIGYLLSPAVREEDLETRVTEIKDALAKLGATVISEGAPEFIDIAYQMVRVIENKNVRFDQAYFGWLKFEADPSVMDDIKELLEKNTLIIRYLLTKTVRENTIIGKKTLGKILKGKRGREDGSDEGEESQESSSVESEPEVPEEKLDEVLDEEIKELVKEI